MNEERLSRDMRFEPDGEGYLFYEVVSSPGVRVTPEERERYLSGNEEGWAALIASREPSAPPRKNDFTLIQKRLASMRQYYFVFLLGIALLIIQAARAPTLFLKIVFALAGMASLILMAIGFFAPKPEKPYGH